MFISYGQYKVYLFKVIKLNRLHRTKIYPNIEITNEFSTIDHLCNHPFNDAENKTVP